MPDSSADNILSIYEAGSKLLEHFSQERLVSVNDDEDSVRCTTKLFDIISPIIQAHTEMPTPNTTHNTAVVIAIPF